MHIVASAPPRLMPDREHAERAWECSSAASLWAEVAGNNGRTTDHTMIQMGRYGRRLRKDSVGGLLVLGIIHGVWVAGSRWELLS